MTAIALLVIAGALYAFASYRREQRIPAAGGKLNDQVTSFVVIGAICVRRSCGRPPFCTCLSSYEDDLKRLSIALVVVVVALGPTSACSAQAFGDVPRGDLPGWRQVFYDDSTKTRQWEAGQTTAIQDGWFT